MELAITFGDFDMCDDEYFLFNVAKELNLSVDETETFVHDYNNLRGDEWIESVSDRCSYDTAKRYIELVHRSPDHFEQKEEALHELAVNRSTRNVLTTGLNPGTGAYVQINNLLVEVKVSDDNLGYIVDVYNNNNEELLYTASIWKSDLVSEPEAI